MVAMNNPKTRLQLIEFKWRAAESLEQPCDYEGSNRIGRGKNRRAGKVTIAEQIACESGSDHTDDNRPPHGRAERDHESGGHARCGPEHRDPIRLVEQSEAKARCEEKTDRDRD